MTQKTFHIVDATGFIFRSYYAIRGMNKPTGESTNAIYGFIRSILKLIKDFSPEHLVCVFDPIDGKAQRLSIFPDYKAHRKAPEDIPYQIEWAKNFCELYGIPVLCIPQHEADDTIASLTKWVESHGHEVRIYSQDKDLVQLISSHTKIVQMHKNNLVISEDNAKEIYGVEPRQIKDYLSIVGDSSDNVPGIAGLGPKAAVSLLEEFDSLEKVYACLDQISNANRKKKLLEAKEIAFLSQKLVELNQQVTIPLEENFYLIKHPHQPELKLFYQDLNFQSLLQELGEEPKLESKISQETQELAYHLVNDEKTFAALKKTLDQANEICFDVEATGLHPIDSCLVGIGFCVQAKEAYYLPLNGALDLQTIQAFLLELFAQKQKRFFGHNVKYDCHLLANIGISYPRISFDTILASYLLYAQNRSHSLDHLALEFFGKQKISLKDLIGSGKKQLAVQDVELEKISNYCCEDVDYTFRLKELFDAQLKTRKLETLLIDLELPLARVLFQMERHGIWVSTNCLKSLETEFQTVLEGLEKEIFGIAGEEFNLNSPKQLSYILFEKLGIHPPKKNKTGFSTDAQVLSSLSWHAPIAKKILDYRQYEKLLSTYIRAIPEEVSSHTGRVHSTFNQFVAATGRLASQKPNFQNIPIRTPEGRRIRSCIAPEKEGWSFLSADYSQIELRLLAHMSEDPALIEAFNKGQDIHAFTASEIFQVPLEEVSYEQRYQAKAVNFGVLYGQQAFGLAKELNIDIKKAAGFIDQYFQRYPKIASFLEELKQAASEEGVSKTLLKRERVISDIQSKNKLLKQQAERLAVNTPIQGTAADLIKMAMLRVQEVVDKEELRGFLLLQVHDELIFELPDEEIERFKKLVKDKMENVFPLKVPLTVNMAVGKNWAQC